MIKGLSVCYSVFIIWRVCYFGGYFCFGFVSVMVLGMFCNRNLFWMESGRKSIETESDKYDAV